LGLGAAELRQQDADARFGLSLGSDAGVKKP